MFNNPTSVYLAAEAATTPRLKLVRMMYAGAIESLQKAKAKLEQGDRPGFVRSVNKAQNIIAELNMALDFERGGEISRNLDSLYEWLQRTLTPACINGHSEPIDHAIRLLVTLQQGWDGIRDTEENPALPQD